MTYQWFNHTTNEMIEIETKCYAVSMPIALSLPALALSENLLIAYRSAYNPKIWVVGHAETGSIVSLGHTRKEAISNAQARLLATGNEKFVSAVETARNTIKGLK